MSGSGKGVHSSLLFSSLEAHIILICPSFLGITKVGAPQALLVLVTRFPLPPVFVFPFEKFVRYSVAPDRVSHERG